MWVWSTTAIIENTSSAQTALFNFCANPPGATSLMQAPGSPGPINELYFYCHSYIHADSLKRAKLHQFLRECHARSIKVHFLDGASDWATTGRSYGEMYVDYLIQFNNEVIDTTARFDGLQLDVEPYLLAGWFTQPIWDGFMTLVTDCKLKVVAAGHPLSYGVCVPRWYDSNPGLTYLQQVTAECDYLAVMDYVDSWTSLSNDIKTELQVAQGLGKKVVLGVETMTISPTSSTFREEGWGNMEGRLFEARKRALAYSSFAGVAIHDYTNYQTLTQWGTGGLDRTAPSILGANHVATDNNGYLTVNVVDVCGTGVNKTITTATARITRKLGLSLSDIAGSWDLTQGPLRFTPTSSIDAGGDFKIVLPLTDLSGNLFTDTAFVTVAAQPLSVYPANWDTAVARNVTLKWNRAFGATTYRLQVSTDSTWASMLVDRSGITDTTASLSGLSASTKYFWRVSASNAQSTSRYSSRVRFITGIDSSSTSTSTSTGSTTTAQPTTSPVTTRKSKSRLAVEMVGRNTFAMNVALDEESIATLSVYDAVGRQVYSLPVSYEGGMHSIIFNATALTPGVYFARLVTTSQQEVQRLVVMR